MVHVIVEEAKTRAQSALADSPIYQLRLLQVEAHQDRLLISGRVKSYYYKQLAQELVRSVTNGYRLENTVVVE